MNDIQRFFSVVDIGPQCWNWKGGTNPKGYGRFWYQGRTMPAHHFSYELIKGAIPEGLQLDHLCRNRGCVNPAHLEAVTGRENLMRGLTLAATNAKKTHCPKGHPFSTENTYHTGANRRLCRTCVKARNDATAEYRRAYYKRRGYHTISSSSE